MATTPTPIGEQLYNNFENNILPSYRAANLVFAYYAAFPLLFSPDMLYQLWLNFQDYQDCQANEAQIVTLPMVVVSDLLQSGMCQEVAFELYELHEEVAAYLKNNIKQLLHAKNIQLLYNHKDIAAFTLGYANQYLQHPNRRNLFDIYYWKSLFEAYPEQASQEIKTAIEKPQIANSDTQNTLYLALAEQQATTHAQDTPEQEYSKLPIFSYQAASDHINITDKYLAQQIADRLGLRESIVTRSESYQTALQRIQQAKATNATQLDLSGLHLTEIPEEIGELVTLKELYLSTGMAGELVSFITDISPLANLTNLTILELRECQISDITPLSNLVQLTDLQIGGNLISDISPLLPHYKRGIKIDVTNNPITTPPIEIVNQGREAILHYFEGQEQAQHLISQVRAQNLKRLDLGNCGLTDLETQIPQLFELEQLEELVLSNKWWDWNKRTWVQSSNKGTPNKLSQIPASINRLKKLSVLICAGDFHGSKWDITNISPLSQLRSLKTLRLEHNKITDLSGISSLNTLVLLDVGGNKLTALSALTALTNLQYLYLGSNQLVSIEPLSHLSSLKELAINSNRITDLLPIKELYRKNAIILADGNPLTNPPIEIVEQGNEVVLRYFDEQENRPQTQAQLLIAQARTQNLKQLDLGNCGLTDLEAQVPELFELEHLEELVLSNKITTSITEKGEVIKIDNPNKLSNLPMGITKLKRLRVLECAGNGIIVGKFNTNADGFITNDSMAYDSWHIKDISLLATLPQLEELNLNNNPIANINPLSALKNLEKLHLAGTHIIGHLQPLSSLVQLKELNLSYTLTANINELAGLTNLQTLILDSNQITDISALKPLTQLKTLDIHANQITDLTPLLYHYKRGVKIEVANNPLTNPPMEIVEQGREAIVNYFEQSKPIKVFIAYSSADSKYLQELRKHLAPLEKAKRIYVWYDGDINPGDEWDKIIKHNLAIADIILLLISADALASKYFHDKEMTKALQRNEQKEAIVIPIIVRPCLWEETPIRQLQVLPQDARPISLWQNPDEAYYSIVRGINAVIESLLKIREVKAQLTTLKANILELLEQNNLEQAQQALQKAYALKLPDPELDELQTVWQKLKVKLPPPIQQLINDMITVEGGSFMMGSNEYGDEKPIHQVNLSTFKIAKYPVTQAQWQAIMGSNPSSFKGEQNPVDSVSWDDTQKFIKKLNALYSSLRGEQSDIPPPSGGAGGGFFRLPTEAEWEYAARGGHKSLFNKGGQEGFTYAGSNNIDEVAWYDGNSGSKTQPVGQKKPNELGIYDMSGNVWEWCQDWYDNSYYKNSPTNNPTGPTSGAYRVLRGGSWLYDAQGCWTADRGSGTPSDRDYNFGFRLVCVP